jgi:putative ABC transport system ATP-binding protein
MADAVPLLRVRGLARRYGDTPVFAGLDCDLAAGEVLALVGESGVGKSTFLNCLAGLDRPDAGSVHLDGRPVTTLTEPESAALRRDLLGFVFQAFHVLPQLDVRDNVALPLRLQSRGTLREMHARAEALLDAVGLQGLARRRPRELSGGQLQRVAIARALVHRPRLILADEPTGNLDPATAEQVLALLVAQAHEHGAACLLVTHSAQAAARADRVLRLTAAGLGGNTERTP